MTGEEGDSSEGRRCRAGVPWLDANAQPGPLPGAGVGRDLDGRRLRVRNVFTGICHHLQTFFLPPPLPVTTRAKGCMRGRVGRRRRGSSGWVALRFLGGATGGSFPSWHGEGENRENVQGKARRGFGRGEQGAPKQPGLLPPPSAPLPGLPMGSGCDGSASGIISAPSAGTAVRAHLKCT